MTFLNFIIIIKQKEITTALQFLLILTITRILMYGIQWQDVNL